MYFLFSSSMYHFKNFNRIKLVCFLKFGVHEMNSKMVVLTVREKTDVTMDWMLQHVAGAMVGERERES
jgi:hypothetical protein